MHGFLLQSWVTLRGTSSTKVFVQSDHDYLDLADYQDFVAWVELTEVTTGHSPVLYLETAPLKDEPLFAPTGGTQTKVSLAVPGIFTAKNLLNAPLVSQIPLARWLRWRVDNAAAATDWSVTFRVHVAAHSIDPVSARGARI